MIEAPERIWVDFRRKDFGRDQKDKGKSAHIGDALDGPDSADAEYVRADRIEALEAENARLRKALQVDPWKVGFSQWKALVEATLKKS